jgi:hypothetical protein
LRGAAPQAPDELSLFGVFIPNDVIAHAQEVAVIGQ